MDDELKVLMRMLISVIARGSYPEDNVRKIVAPTKSSGGYLSAYNLCDGKHTRPDIRKATGLDKDNLNKAVKRWIASGLVFEIEQDGETYLLHLFPLNADAPAKPKGKGAAESIAEPDHIDVENTDDAEN